MKILSFSDHDQYVPREFTDDSPVQFTWQFSKFSKNYYGELLYYFYSENLKAYVAIKRSRIKFFSFGQIMHAPIHNNVELSAEDQLSFYNELIAYLKKVNFCDRLIQPHPFGIMKAVPPGAKSCRFGTYINKLQEHSEEELLYTFDPKYRRAVNAAEKGGAEVKFGWEQFRDFYLLYQQTTSRAHIHCDPVKYFEMQHRYLDEHTDCGVVYDKGQPIGGIWMLYSKYAALCTHAGSGGESKLYGAMKLLHYEMMKQMKARGVKYYDLVGVRIGSSNESLEGVFRFKKGFGGDLKEGFLWKTDIANNKMKLFDLLMRIRGNNAQVKDIIDQETTAA